MNHIDKMFKNKLEHYTVNIPDDAWENIATRLDDEEKAYRPGMSYFFALISMFILVIISLYFISMPENVNKEIVTSGAKHVLHLSKEPLKHAAGSVIQGSLKKIVNSEGVSGQYKNDKRNSNASVAENLGINTVFSDAQYKTNETRSIVEEPFEIFNSATEVHTSQDENLTLESLVSEHGEAHEARKVENIELLNNQLAQSTSGFFNNMKRVMNFRKAREIKACPFVFDERDKSLDAYFSNDYAFRQLKSSSGVDLGYLNMRNQTEHSQYSFSAGLRFGYNISYRWNLHTGINYSQINEKFEYVDPESNQTRLITIKDYVYLNGKVVDSIVTEQVVVIPGTTKIKVYNRYKSFDIPVVARYTLFANRHLSLSGMSGVYINVGFSQKGMILSHDGTTPVDITSDSEQGIKTFKTQLGISAYGSLSLAYHVTSTIDFLFEPNVRIQTESMTNGEYPLTQRYNTVGLSTGLRYKF